MDLFTDTFPNTKIQHEHMWLTKFVINENYHQECKTCCERRIVLADEILKERKANV